MVDVLVGPQPNSQSFREQLNLFAQSSLVQSSELRFMIRVCAATNNVAEVPPSSYFTGNFLNISLTEFLILPTF
jgi:hypothetical protein